MKRRILITLLCLSSVSCADRDAILEQIAMNFQQELNAGNIQQALQFWKSSSNDTLQEHALVTIGQVFNNINLITDSLESSCDNSGCQVNGRYNNDQGEVRNVTYSFVSQVNGIKLSNIQTASL